jgi:hypothetical protein
MKRGFIDLEVAMTFFLGLMLVATGFSMYRVWATGQAASPSSSQWSEICQNGLDQLNQDLKYAQLLRVASDTLEVRLPDNRSLTFRFENEQLSKVSSTGETQVLFGKVQSGNFIQSQRFPKLISLLILSKDQMNYPFFTSFTLRGTEP